ITSSVRRCAAVDVEMPRPVASATYATTQAGHLGSSASAPLGTIHPAISPPRRQRDPGRRTAALPDGPVPVWRAGWAFMNPPPAFLAPTVGVLIAAAPPDARLVAALGGAVEPLVHAPEPVQSARVGGIGVVGDSILEHKRTHARPLANVGGHV